MKKIAAIILSIALCGTIVSASALTSYADMSNPSESSSTECTPSNDSSNDETSKESTEWSTMSSDAIPRGDDCV